jgi:hypothetical protein
MLELAYSFNDGRVVIVQPLLRKLVVDCGCWSVSQKEEGDVNVPDTKSSWSGGTFKIMGAIEL